MNFIRTLVLILGCISFVIVVGGATYEHLAVVPVWASALPASLSMFQGEYAIAAQRFWIPIHPVTLAFLVSGLILNWTSRRRTFILAGIAGYVLVLLITFLYFVPELMALTSAAYGPTLDPELTQRAKTWETLSLVRLGFMVILAVILLFAISRPLPTDRLRGRYF